MKIAIGCLVQWFECDMIEEYVNSLIKAQKQFTGELLVDFSVVSDETLEKCISKEQKEKCIRKIFSILTKIPCKARIKDHLYTIADYRREFNNTYCTQADILVWGESDMLVPSQMFQSIELLHNQTKEITPKWVGFFSTCKMWDDSWKILEHPELTNHPRDPYAWYGTRCYMDYNTMDQINSKVTTPEVISTFDYKFNGCGLVLSSELIKSGVNIPHSVFFTHEDTGLMNLMLNSFKEGKVPQYIFKNILLVHNREHPNKRKYVLGEEEGSLTTKRLSNKWYTLASTFSKNNAYSLMNQGNHKFYTWEDVWSNL